MSRILRRTRSARLSSHSAAGFTMAEILVVIAVIAALIAILVPALQAAIRGSKMTASQSNMRQIHVFLQEYANLNRDTILPSQFDYSNSPYMGKVRSTLGSDALGLPNQGTWTDILWTTFDLNNLPDAIASGAYRYDSPDKEVYDNLVPGYDGSVLRSAMVNSHDYRLPNGTLPGASLATPYGQGAAEEGLPGYFAANDFFDARPGAPDYVMPDPNDPVIDTPDNGRWYTMGEMKVPNRSMYLVDSLAGEVIYADPESTPKWAAFDCRVDVNAGDRFATTEVDFRYNGACLMLFLDGSIEPQSRWKNLDDLEDNRKVRVRWLDRR